MPTEVKRVGVVMAGGSGERFWPLSTDQSPKQLLNLTHPHKSMLLEAVERLEAVVDQSFVATTTKFQGVISEKGVVPADRVFAEPAKRNTLGALVWVVSSLLSLDLGDVSVAVVTADHYIGDVPSFQRYIAAALTLAELKQGIVTLGVRPTRPETGYGYIEIDSEQTFDVGQGLLGYAVSAFREKPDQATAHDYLLTGKHLWNSGMFFFTVPAFLKELSKVLPEVAETAEKIATALKNGDAELAKTLFETVPNKSIDFAVIEKLDTLYVVPVDFPWDDVGAWDALERAEGPSEHGNSVRGEPILVEVTDSIVVQSDQTIHVAVMGVSDLIIVSTGNAVLVCHKSQAQRVRELAQHVAARTADAKTT